MRSRIAGLLLAIVMGGVALAGWYFVGPGSESAAATKLSPHASPSWTLTTQDIRDNAPDSYGDSKPSYFAMLDEVTTYFAARGVEIVSIGLDPKKSAFAIGVHSKDAAKARAIVRSLPVTVDLDTHAVTPHLV